jgi:hypothetical protein
MFKIPNWNLEHITDPVLNAMQKPMPAKAVPLSLTHLEQTIYLIRGQKVLLDRDLAALYGVETGGLNRAVRRNKDRFPTDFMFELTRDEAERSRCQFGILNAKRRGQNIKYRPLAFTEQGVAMLSTVLNSPRAIHVNIAIMRVFVRLRETLSLHKELAQKLAELERKFEGHDEHIRTLFEAIRQLAAPPVPELPGGKEDEMGFHVREDSAPYRFNGKNHSKTRV